jgi:hypothetical protein
MSIKTRLGLILWLVVLPLVIVLPSCVQLKHEWVRGEPDTGITNIVFPDLPPSPPAFAERSVQRYAVRTPVAPPVVPKVQLFWDAMMIDPLEMPASATNYRILVLCSTNQRTWSLKTNVKASPVIFAAGKECEFYRLRVTNTYLKCSYD